MAIQVSCKFCFKTYNVKDAAAGKSFLCTSCQEEVRVPAAQVATTTNNMAANNSSSVNNSSVKPKVPSTIKKKPPQVQEKNIDNDFDDFISKASSSKSSSPRLPGISAVKKPPKVKSSAKRASRSQETKRPAYNSGAGQIAGGILSFIIIFGLVGMRLYVKFQKDAGNSSTSTASSSSSTASDWNWFGPTDVATKLGNGNVTMDISKKAIFKRETDGALHWTLRNKYHLIDIVFREGDIIDQSLFRNPADTSFKEQSRTTINNTLVKIGYTITSNLDTEVNGIFGFRTSATQNPAGKVLYSESVMIFLPEGILTIECVAISSTEATNLLNAKIASLK